VGALKNKTLVCLAIAALLLNVPCIAACFACATPPPSASHCHHKAPPHDDGKQPCPHQLFRATGPVSRLAQQPASYSPAVIADDIKIEVPRVAGSAQAPLIGWSPPLPDSTRPSILRV